MDNKHTPKDNVNVPAPTAISPLVNPTPAGQPETAQRLANIETNIEERMSAFERASIRWTKGMFAVTLATGIFIALQWWEIRTGSVDTHALAEAAKKQSENTAKQLPIAETQANAAQESVKAIQRQMRQDQRPWITANLNWPKVKGANGEEYNLLLFTDDKPLLVPLQMANTGKTPARRVVAEMFAEVVKSSLPPQLNSNRGPIYGYSAGILPPNTPNPVQVARQQVVNGAIKDDLLRHSEREDLVTAKAYIAIYRTITYDDIFGRNHWTKFCLWFAIAPTQSVYNSKSCSDYNQVDQN